MIRYCPTCERSTLDARFIGEFCEFCTIKRLSKDVPDTIDVDQCKVCNREKGVTEFMDSSQKAVSEVVQREIRNKDIHVSSVKAMDKGVLVRLNFMVGKDELVFEKLVGIRRHRLTCPKCVRMKSGYYQAIVQLRGNEDKVNRLSGRIIRFVERRESFVARMAKVRGGMDLYIEDKAKVGAFFDIYKEFKPKKSYTLAGMKNGKKLYRVTFSVDLKDKEG